MDRRQGQALFATMCDNDKGIWVGVGPLPWLVDQLFGLVGVGPYRPSGTELGYQNQPGPQAQSAKKCKVQVGLDFGASWCRLFPQ